MRELLSPVQDFVSLRAAIDGGADAVYFGIRELNMRMGAKNFRLSETGKVIEICHKHKVRAYFVLNSIVYDKEIGKIKKILRKLKKERIDAIICWDFSVIKECEILHLPIHLSTQASVSNFDSLVYLKNSIRNLKRINLARELSLDQIKEIIKRIKKNRLKLEIEVFIHGAMCVSISGRCFMSQEVFNRSANRGECLQPCRRRYIIKDIEEDHEFCLGEDYVLSPKDLCTADIMNDLIKAEISAFKIEGRNRSPEYVKTVTESYRQLIDCYPADKGLIGSLKESLRKVYNRGFSTGFYLGRPEDGWSRAYGSMATERKRYIGRVVNFYRKQSVAEIIPEAGELKQGDTIIFQGNKTGVFRQEVASIEVNKKKLKKIKKGSRAAIKTQRTVRKNDKVFKVLS